MDIIIKAVKFKPSIILETFVREKVNKLYNQCHNIIRANVILREEKNRKPGNKLCKIKLMIPGNDHFVRKSSEVYEKSVLQAVEVLQKILRRKKPG